jgi:hypothetical protein
VIAIDRWEEGAIIPLAEIDLNLSTREKRHKPRDAGIKLHPAAGKPERFSPTQSSAIAVEIGNIARPV